MQNDVLKNTIAPWQEKGRWYHAYINNSGIVANKSDQWIIDNMTFSGGTYTLNNTEYNILDYVINPVKFTPSATRNYAKQFNYLTTGETSISGLNPSTFNGEFHIYLFITPRI